MSDNGDQDFSESARSSELRAFVSNAPALPVTLQLVTYIQPRLSREGNRAEVTTEIALEGDVSATYDYLRHAAPSFSAQAAETSLDIDFGTVAIGAHREFKWSVFNRGNADTVGLDLDSIASTDEAAGKFVFEHLGPFSALAAGTRKEFAVRLDTSTSGAFVAEYRFGLSDADVGEESTRRSSNLTLRLRGNVAAPVPEPAEWLLMAAGVGTLAYSRRRRRCPPSS